VAGLLHAVKAAESTLHRNVAPLSISLKPKLAELLFARLPFTGPELIDGAGGAVRSMV
jgi:hypothetical protein